MNSDIDFHSCEIIEGIGKKTAQKLLIAGIANLTDLKHIDAPHIARATGLSEKKLLFWKSMAVLMQVHGIDHQVSEVLVRNGISSLRKLVEIGSEKIFTMLHDARYPNAGIRNIIPDTYHRSFTQFEIQDWQTVAELIGSHIIYLDELIEGVVEECLTARKNTRLTANSLARFYQQIPLLAQCPVPGFTLPAASFTLPLSLYCSGEEPRVPASEMHSYIRLTVLHFSQHGICFSAEEVTALQRPFSKYITAKSQLASLNFNEGFIRTMLLQPLFEIMGTFKSLAAAPNTYLVNRIRDKLAVRLQHAAEWFFNRPLRLRVKPLCSQYASSETEGRIVQLSVSLKKKTVEWIITEKSNGAEIVLTAGSSSFLYFNQ